MSETIKRALQEMRHLKSIAVPALGTGPHAFAPEDAAEIIIGSVLDALSETPHSVLQELSIVIAPQAKRVLQVVLYRFYFLISFL